jgi:hypothetical protein
MDQAQSDKKSVSYHQELQSMVFAALGAREAFQQPIKNQGLFLQLFLQSQLHFFGS